MKQKLTTSLILSGLLIWNTVEAAPFLGPLVKCGRVGKDPCKIGDLFRDVFIIINFLVGAATILTMGYIVYGGVRMILAAGDPAQIKNAKSTMTNAIVGLVMIILSYVIVGSVVAYFTGYSFDEIRAFLR